MKHSHSYRSIKKLSCHAFTRSGVISLVLLLLITMVTGLNGFAQIPLAANAPIDNSLKQSLTTVEQTDDEIEEVMILLDVPRIGSVEIRALIYDEVAFLSVKEIFDFLKIRNTPSNDFTSIEGFLIDRAATYNIDGVTHQIIYQDKKYQLQSSDIITNESGIYLRSGIFGRVFGLDCQFSFRSLSVKLVTNAELPALREMKLEAMHRNLNQLNWDRKADTTIKRKFSLFRLGMLDWSVIGNGESFLDKNTRITLGLGSIIAGGEANFFLNYYRNQPLKLKDQYYFWRHVNNDNKVIRQIILGKILANPSSTVYNGINGIQINNTPTTYRRSFGSFTISDKTEPGWMVELYVNNVLINYTRADASGFFTFDVPMVYGNSVVKLRFYGPWGEEQSREQNLAIPFNFLPKNQFEYNVSAGIVEDDMKSRFSRTQLNYGLSKRVTIGGGMEYLSSVSKKVMPFFNASVRLGSNFFITGEHMQGVKTNGMISYRFPSNLRIEMNYLRYEKGQQAIRATYLEEKKLIISKPFTGRKYSLYSRLTINQFDAPYATKQSKYTAAELLFSAVAFGISSNITNYFITNESGMPLAYTNLYMTFRLPHGFNFLPQAQYEYTRKKFSFIKTEIEKSIFNKGFLNVSYEWDMKNKNYVMSAGLRYNLSFAQTAFSVRKTKQTTSYAEMVRGSLMLSGNSNHIRVNNLNNVGKAGLVIAPFLDLNNNGKRDAGEPAAEGLRIRINGGRIQRHDRDTTIYVNGLDAYTNYFLELDKNSFENISWQIKNSTIKIALDPNHFTYLEIPVTVMSEIAGTVYLYGIKGSNGLGRMIVNIYNSDSVLVARTMSEADGYFSYLGLQPGTYTINIDGEQLNKLNMKNSSGSSQVQILKKTDGDTVNGIVFILKPNNNQ